MVLGWGAWPLLTSNDLIALPLVLLAAPIAAVVARQARPSSWPRSLLLILVALAGWGAMVSEGMIDNYVRWLFFRVDWVLAVIPVLAFLIWRLTGRVSNSLVVRTWISAAFAFIALATVTTDEHGTVAFNGSVGLAACVADRSAWLSNSVSDLFTDLLPNLALFAPLGYGLAALGWRWRPVLITAALLSMSIEMYQALFTDRVCAPRDLACNALGALVGAALLYLVCGGPTIQPSNERPDAPDREVRPVETPASRTPTESTTPK